MPKGKNSFAASEVEQVDVGVLVPAEYNPRVIDDDTLEQLSESIRRHGLVEPIVVNRRKGRHGVIVGGHSRAEAAKLVGMGKVPVVWVDLSLKEEKELNLRLNKNTGHWDSRKLVEMDRAELMDAGFSESDIIRAEAEAGTLDDIEVESNRTGKDLILAFRTRAEYQEMLAHYVGGNAIERTESLIEWLRTEYAV